MTCSVDGCTLRAIARGWCKPHYQRWQRTGDVHASQPVYSRRVGRPRTTTIARAEQAHRIKEKQYAWTCKERILDWLQADGGWLTTEGLAEDIKHHPTTVNRKLLELLDEGLVEYRIVELSLRRVGGVDSRREWRAV